MYSLRNVTENDAATLRSLAKRCPPLDLHTPYTYWVIAKYFSDSSFILEQDGHPVGFITALDTPSGVFVWQIGILEDHRGSGLSRLLIDAVFDYARGASKRIEVTIAEKNTESKAAFMSACENAGGVMEAVGRVVVRDIDDPDFCEEETCYLITL